MRGHEGFRRSHKLVGENGRLYTAIVYTKKHTLLSYDTEAGIRFVVVENLTQGIAGYTWSEITDFEDRYMDAFRHMKAESA